MQSTMIKFPFERERYYPIGDLRRFEAALLDARQRDPALSALWRCPSGPDAELMRLRNDELVPLIVFAEHKELTDSDSFRISAKGDPIDVKVLASGKILNLQITVADLDWGDSDGGPGFQHHLSMEALNKYGVVFGHGPFRRTGREITNPIEVYSSEDRLAACHRGLVRALNRKSHYDGSGCSLVVYARGYRIQTIDGEFREVVSSAIATCELPAFDHVYITEKGEGWFVEAP
jgi:hypothetical protein